MRRRCAMAVAVLLVATMVTGCGDDAPDRSAVLGDLADQTIIPAYDDLALRTRALHDATTTLCEAPDDEALVEARAALAGARSGWSTTESMWVGPAMDRRSWAVIDWPVAADEIESLIGDTDVALTVDSLSSRIGADQRGLRAVEYVLWAPDPQDAATVTVALADERRCAYLTGVSELIATEAAVLLDAWSVGVDGDDAYRDTFVGSDDGIDTIVGDIAFLLEAMTDAELGVALGEMEQDADPDAVVDGPAALGVADLRAHLDGIRAVLVGTAVDTAPTGTLAPLLGDDLVGRLDAELEAATDALDEIVVPLRDAVVDEPATVAAARDAIKAVQVTVTTEVVSRLGVTIGFSDADGDSG